MLSLRDISKIEPKIDIRGTLKPKIKMHVLARNLKDVLRNIKVGFFSKENTETLYGVAIVL